jgi:magnesium transporter
MIQVVQFDFQHKRESSIDPAHVQAGPPPEMYYWIHTDPESLEESRALLERLGCGIDPEELQTDQEAIVDLREDHLSIGLSEVRLADGNLSSTLIRAVLGRSFLLTVAAPESVVMRQVREAYRDDFHEFAQSPGFMLFELVDSLTRVYQTTFRHFEKEIDRLQQRLLGSVDDQIFFRVAETTRQLLAFRLALVSARETLTALVSRKSPFIRETTQPFLQEKIGLLSQLSDDLAIQRAVISDSLNLYLGYVSYQTNTVINRLTIISVIFLPLTFLVGVYGMNFRHMPELDLWFAYPLFWVVVVLIVTTLLIYFRTRKWLT